MANIEQFFSSSKITSVSFSNNKLEITFNYSQQPIPERIIADLILAIEQASKDKRTNINSPISEKEMEDNPKMIVRNRSNSNGTLTETQLEYLPQISLWFKMSPVGSLEPVNDSD